MKRRRIAFVVSVLFAGISVIRSSALAAQPTETRVVRIAELTIDPAQIVEYNQALREEIAASIRVEPGVLALYAVSVKDQPNHIMLFEIYATPAAYDKHLRSAHFLRYKTDTAGMVKSLKLLETDPILLGAK